MFTTITKGLTASPKAEWLSCFFSSLQNRVQQEGGKNTLRMPKAKQNERKHRFSAQKLYAFMQKCSPAYVLILSFSKILCRSIPGLPDHGLSQWRGSPMGHESSDEMEMNSKQSAAPLKYHRSRALELKGFFFFWQFFFTLSQKNHHRVVLFYQISCTGKQT